MPETTLCHPATASLSAAVSDFKNNITTKNVRIIFSGRCHSFCGVWRVSTGVGTHLHSRRYPRLDVVGRLSSPTPPRPRVPVARTPSQVLFVSAARVPTEGGFTQLCHSSTHGLRWFLETSVGVVSRSLFVQRPSTSHLAISSGFIIRSKITGLNVANIFKAHDL